MTPEQLERSARHYCKLMGVDPDELVGHGADPNPSGYTPMVLMHSPRWKLITRELHDAWAMNEALKEGMRDPKVDEVVGGLFPIGRG